MVNARDRMPRVFVGVALLGATLPETDANWLSPSTRKRFQDTESKGKGTSSLSQNSRLGVSMVIHCHRHLQTPSYHWSTRVA